MFKSASCRPAAGIKNLNSKISYHMPAAGVEKFNLKILYIAIWHGNIKNKKCLVCRLHLCGKNQLKIFSRGGPGPESLAGVRAPPGAGPVRLSGAAAPPGAGPVRLSGARGPAGVNPGPRKTLQ